MNDILNDTQNSPTQSQIQKKRGRESITCKSESGNLHQTINSQTKLEAIDSECAGILTNNNKSIET